MNSRVLKLAIGVALVASLASVGTASARYTGADYCAVNNNGTWSLVGGGSCNPNPGKSANSSWTEAYILDFGAKQIINATTGNQVGSTFGSVEAMLIELSADYASHDASGDWMYVANSNSKLKNIVYLLVPESSCSGASEWYMAPACD